ncbi:MAG: 2-succinyl-5-enolpyruvyl-6-hydroxy-3-cyclohexene-1-carboxylate synthase, partial [Bacteroidetes bacterium]|nr:2-succinyl-5-enolpyruvyl-6-hydroxy-3-cyclohexene-1-carboxylate synthase [Bacteroidota bacterium]
MNRCWADLIVEELVRCGVTQFYLAPGSRSTPLTTAVAAHPKAQATIHYDERGTAFMALGYGRATGRPAAWITTSGTAVANGMPAVVEASVDRVPLLLLTADRPPELRDTGANQTIDQVKLFGEYVRWFVDLPTPTDEIDPAY